MKKILIYSTAYYPCVGGAEVAIKEITDRINTCVFDMITVRLDRSPTVEQLGSVLVHRVGIYPYRGSRSIIMLNKYLFPFWGALYGYMLNRTKHYDKAWAMMASFAGFATLFFHILTHTPYVLSLQEGDSFQYIYKKVGILRPLFKMIFRKAFHIQVLSAYLQQFALDNGALKKQISIVPNGVDLTVFTKELSARDRMTYRRTMFPGITDTDTLVVSTSRLVYKNGIDILIDAFYELPTSYKLALIGDGQLEMSLKKQAEKLGDRVVFLGHMDHIELQPYLASADIFIRPSRSEGMGNSFIEAMAARVPVIAPAVGGVVDFVHTARDAAVVKPTGIVLDDTTPESISEAIGWCAAHIEVQDTIVQNAYELVTGTYSWERVAPLLYDIFNIEI